VLNNEAQAAVSKLLLSPVSAANTAAATSAWIDVRDSVGDVMFVNQVGALTGTIVWTIEHATDNSGTGGAAIVPNEGAYATVTANSIQKRTISANACQGFVRCVGTIVTGPALVAASVHTRPQIA
jgi:hypothetical protein